MSLFTPASEVLERNKSYFIDHAVYFAGDIQDDYPAKCMAKSVYAHCTQYHHWLRLTPSLQKQVTFGLFSDAKQVTESDVFVFYWYKNKKESQFQLMSLLSQMKQNDILFVVGENRVGVKHTEKLLADLGPVTKIDAARRCSLYHFQLQQKVSFDLASWWSEYHYEDLTLKALPGAFSHEHLDAGSELLISVLQQNREIIKGNVLDMGCGVGVLGAVAQKLVPEIQLTLVDVSAAALMSSEATLKANQLSARVIASDVFSSIQERYHLIISNPPFHEGRHIDLSITEKFIQQAKTHLPIGGKLCLVANGFLPYPMLLDRVFGSYKVIAETSKFKVYLAEVSLKKGK